MSSPASEAILARRSSLDAWYEAYGHGASLREDMWQAVTLNERVPRGRFISLMDCSWRRRFGVKGPNAEAWLAAHDFAIPSPANSWRVTDGVMVGRLASSEFLIECLDGQPARVTAAATQLAARPSGVFAVMRQDLVVQLSGEALSQLLQQICSVDFATLLAGPSAANGPLVLTSMMGVGVVAVPMARDADPTLTLWIEPSFAHYFWTTLIIVAAELGGGVRLDQPIRV